jgi:hypothetical protein
MKEVWVLIGRIGLHGGMIGPAVFDFPVTREEIEVEMKERFPEDYEYIQFGIWKEIVNTKEVE